MILLAKRYQTNPQGGFPTFQIYVQMIDFTLAETNICFIANIQEWSNSTLLLSKQRRQFYGAFAKYTL